jgi:hypothetical protein
MLHNLPCAAETPPLRARLLLLVQKQADPVCWLDVQPLLYYLTTVDF